MQNAKFSRVKKAITLNLQDDKPEQPACDSNTQKESLPRSHLSALQVKRFARKGARMFMVQVTKEQDNLFYTIKQEDLRKVVEEFSDVFPAEVPPGLPPDRGTKHSIPLMPGSTPPFKGMLSTITHRNEGNGEKQISELIEKGWIEPSTSPYGAPILFVVKKNGELRMCIDYRALNQLTIKNRYPLPRIDDLFDCLQGAKFFTSLDLAQGYHQIQILDEDVPKTAFRTPKGHFQFRVLSFGLTNAPATFQTAMNEMLAPYLRESALVYLDDILIYSKTWEEHLIHVRQVLQKLREYKFYAKLKKCNFGETSLAYLGHIVSGEGIKVDPKKIEVVKDWARPTTVKQIRSFLGFANYFRKFVKGYSIIVKPLTDLTQANRNWDWTESCERSVSNGQNDAHNSTCVSSSRSQKAI